MRRTFEHQPVEDEQRDDVFGTGGRGREDGVVAHPEVAGEQCDRRAHRASVRWFDAVA
jgi:hypothetical protein